MEKKWPVALLAARIGKRVSLEMWYFSEEDFGHVFKQFADRDGSLRIIGVFPIPLTGTM